MTDGTPPSVLQIKKYPNRRFYDATRSRHVTLHEMHGLVLDGHTLRVTDSRTGEDLTNVIMVQIMLEKDPPKLHLFPAWVFHVLLRSSQSATRRMIEQMFGPFTQAWARGQRSLDEVLHQFMSGKVTTPMDWASNMMRLFTSAYPGAGANGRTDAAEVPNDDPEDDLDDAADLAAIQEQVTELNNRLARLKARNARSSGARRHT